MTRFLSLKLCLVAILLVSPLLLFNKADAQVTQTSHDFNLSTYVTNTIQLGRGPHIEVALVSELDGAKIGQEQWLGILLSTEKHWHTYWRNAGDSGEPPTVNWQSPSDITFGEFHWPIPTQIPVAHLTNYGYEGKTLLMVPFTINNLVPEVSQVSITADLSWLVCKEDCIPGWATLSIELPVLDSPKVATNGQLFEQTRKLLPQPEKLSALYEVTDQFLTLSLELPSKSNWQLLPFRSDLIQHSAQQQWLTEPDDVKTNVLLQKSDYFSVENEPTDWLLTDGKKGYYVQATVNTTNPPIPHGQASIWLMVLFAFIGGLILNIMPCVLPVLSLKAMSVTSSGDNKNHWGYLIGIMVSFGLFATLIITLKASGNAIGWGFHLQEPLVIAFLAFLFVFIALMLWDLVPNVAGISGLGQNLTQGDSFTSSFFTGVLAVIVASPCTAPFMATALGVAMVSPAYVTFLIFAALGLGFALPMTLLSLSPRFARLLPKPGAWMNTFKHFLAFPMLATVIWLIWVFLGQTNSLGQLWLLTGLLSFAFCFWLASLYVGKKALLATIFGLFVAFYTSIKGSELATTAQVITQSSFSEQKLANMRNNNQVIVVNMTADWCITCKVNEQVAFSDETLQAVLAQENVQYLVGDWTNKNQEILDYLTRYQRSGVPLYVVYAGNQSEQVLPQVLTSDIVINAIQQAQQELNNATL
ncbi:thiol:disulfide interchange protein DsbD [Thalassotalea loyana]|uniref:Thiol:disulfide interchange protein DsbD n=1 Tax=Thalassotalea loyana TaxID=280483 RepID=A0ABQ6HAI0_9GAMM|nr:thioredoxin family protein [Thalassotalea loyana]GLX85136.1 thiol:disulfide interchange protein DsbD [Thalassotalea loyana]